MISLAYSTRFSTLLACSISNSRLQTNYSRPINTLMLIGSCIDRQVNRTYAKVLKSKTVICTKLAACYWQLVPYSQNKIPIAKTIQESTSVAFAFLKVTAVSHVCVTPDVHHQMAESLCLQTRCTTLLSVTTHFSTNTYHIPHSINLFVIFRSISRDTVICLSIFSYSEAISIKMV